MNATDETLAKLDLERLMRVALEQAQLAASSGNLPIGALIVLDGEIVGRGHNTCESERNQIKHAEINALLNASSALWNAGQRWARRDQAVLLTSVEPCPMCLGAIVMADIPHIVFAAHDHNVCSQHSLENPYIKRHITTYLGGVLEQESRALIATANPLMLRTLDRRQPSSDSA